MPRIEGETYFNNFEQSGYDELKSWTPEYYQGIKEADANLRFAGKTIDQMAQALEEWCANMFIDTMSEEVLSRIEAFYYLDNSSRSIDERRRLLKAAQLGSGKMDIDRIKRIIKVYANTDCTVEFIHELNITLDAGDKKVSFTDFTTILGSQLPAHIKWHVHQEMRQREAVYYGAVTRQTYIGAPIAEISGSRERAVSIEQSYAGAEVTLLQVAPPIIDGGDRAGRIAGQNGTGIKPQMTVSQIIS